MMQPLLQGQDGEQSMFQPSNSFAALWRAAESGDCTVIDRLLASRRGDAGSTDGGITALYVASQNGHLNIVRALCRHHSGRAATSSQTPTGACALHIAARQRHTTVLSELVAAYMSLRAQRSPVDSSTDSGCEEDEDKDVGVDLHNLRSITPLMLAAFQSHVECVRVLLGAGADPALVGTVKNARGWATAGGGGGGSTDAVIAMLLAAGSSSPARVACTANSMAPNEWHSGSLPHPPGYLTDSASASSSTQRGGEGCGMVPFRKSGQAYTLWPLTPRQCARLLEREAANTEAHHHLMSSAQFERKPLAPDEVSQQWNDFQQSVLRAYSVLYPSAHHIE